MIALVLTLVLPASAHDLDPRAEMAARVMATHAVDPDGDTGGGGGGIVDPDGDVQPGGGVSDDARIVCEYPIFRDPRWHAAVQADLPPRTVGWKADLLQQLSVVDPGRTALRATPGVLLGRGGAFLSGTPIGDRTVRLDGIELLAR
ncbi:MAG: hypothetical protein H6742_18835 [Alphaproteobacteria bacterium]|nr:hypothetical protein [Alphaproteobacteria bacterium]